MTHLSGSSSSSSAPLRSVHHISIDLMMNLFVHPSVTPR